MTVELTCPMIDVMNVSASKVLDICKIVGLEHSYVYIYKCGRWLDMDIQNLGKIWLISFFFFALGVAQVLLPWAETHDTHIQNQNGSIILIIYQASCRLIV